MELGLVAVVQLVLRYWLLELVGEVIQELEIQELLLMVDLILEEQEAVAVV
jgi:hypothetical protein